jgi:hypothetical protein
VFIIVAILSFFFTPFSITYYRSIDKNNETPLPVLPRKNFRPPPEIPEEELGLSMSDVNIPSSADVAASVDPTGVLAAKNKLANLKGNLTGEGGKQVGNIKIMVQERAENIRVTFKEFLLYLKAVNKKALVICCAKGTGVGAIFAALFAAVYGATYPFLGYILAPYIAVANPTASSSLDAATAACSGVSARMVF